VAAGSLWGVIAITRPLIAMTGSHPVLMLPCHATLGFLTYLLVLRLLSRQHLQDFRDAFDQLLRARRTQHSTPPRTP
jgi:hypothetical protein